MTGDYIEINYNDFGTWNRSSISEGLLIADSDGTFLDVTYPGSPWSLLAVEYDIDTTGYTYYGSSYSEVATYTVNDESDLSDGTTLTSAYDLTAGDLNVIKTETWEEDDTIVSIEFQITNDGVDTLENVRVFYAFDPDQDYDSDGVYTTYNDVTDTDGDGDNDWGSSEGTSSGITVGFGACDDDAQEIGHFSGWSTVADADTTLSDDDGVSGDSALGW
ncbi:MAG: hypothetical protein AAFV53_20480, partial [Myxococcota bacterium]